MSYVTPIGEQHTCTWQLALLPFPTTQPTSTSFNFLPREIEHCADPQEVSLGCLAEPITFTGYEPKDLAGNEDLRVEPLFFHRPTAASAYDFSGKHR